MIHTWPYRGGGRKDNGAYVCFLLSLAFFAPAYTGTVQYRQSLVGSCRVTIFVGPPCALECALWMIMTLKGRLHIVRCGTYSFTQTQPYSARTCCTSNDQYFPPVPTEPPWPQIASLCAFRVWIRWSRWSRDGAGRRTCSMIICPPLPSRAKNGGR